MNRFEEDRKRKIYEITAVVKVIFVFFAAIAIFSNITVHDKNLFDFGKTVLSTVFIFGLVYQLWAHSIRKTKISDHIGTLDIIELIMHIVINIGIILYTGAHTSQYKTLFLFTILTTTLQFGMRSGLVVSAIASTGIIALDLVAMPFNQPNPYFQSDLVLIGVFFISSWLLGYYIQTEQFFRNILSSMANMDELTGLSNHRCFQDALKTQMDRASAIDEPFSLLLADIDYFKHYNEIYGHQAGDLVLLEISRIIEDIIGSRGTAYRYGGEEFAVILPRTSEKKAILIAEEIRKNVETHSFDGEENLPNGKLTISIGVSSYPDKANTPAELVSSADEALYRAKFISKNKVEVYFSVIDELKNELDEEHLDLISSIKTLISVINAKDRYTFGHTERVVRYCTLIGEAMGLAESDIKILQYGAYLHDIGKIEIPKELLNKKEKLDESEWEQLKQHPKFGADIIKPVDSLKPVLPLVLYHHERLDGKGYPNQLKDSQIPTLVRILTIADSFDAMTTSRPYKVRKSLYEAIDELRRCSGTQFDGEIVENFIKLIYEKPEHFQSLQE